MQNRTLRRAALCSGTAITLGTIICASVAHAQPAPQAVAANVIPETVVITGTAFNTDLAPAKESVNTQEPQTIITKQYIQDSISPIADYVTILAITPSLTGQDINGPGLSDGGVKNTLRGQPDGNFNMTYDGIPFGDTNGPSHHSVSYFPGSTIGSIEVERGPGNAGNLGAASYGGSINIYSEPVIDNTRALLEGTYGTWETKDAVVNFQSGDLPGLNNAKFLFNWDYLASQGALTGQHVNKENILLKIQDEIAPNWVVTVFGDYEDLAENLNDNNGATPAQVATYGKNFAMQDSNPKLSTYIDYGWTHKYTDMDYIRLQGDAGIFRIDNNAYTYAYVNHTWSSRNIEQNITDIINDTTEGQGGKLAPIVNGVVQPNDVPGYEKLNEYRVFGDILRVNADYDFGWLTGQVRAGVWLEAQATERTRQDYDMTLCNNMGLQPWRTNATPCEDSSLGKKAKLLTFAQTGQPNPNYNGYAEFLEHSGWDQEEPFIEVDIDPLPNLTLTPGFRYVNWVHRTNAPLEPKSLILNYNAHFTTDADLPFFGANYKIFPNWSVYAQYAQGIYVPDISIFEVSSPAANFPAAERTTNYQVGTVYYTDNFTVDGDLYYIPISNNIVSVNGGVSGCPQGETCYQNTGQAVYQGVEGEATYAVPDEFMDGLFHGLVIFANGAYNSARSNHFQLKAAPLWTSAAGLIYKVDAWRFSLIAKGVGPQWSDNKDNPLYKVHAYSDLTFSTGYTFGGRYELSVSVDNLLGTRNTLSITENDSTYQTDRLMSIDQYFFQPARSAMLTLKALVY